MTLLTSIFPASPPPPALPLKKTPGAAFLPDLEEPKVFGPDHQAYLSQKYKKYAPVTATLGGMLRYFRGNFPALYVRNSLEEWNSRRELVADPVSQRARTQLINLLEKVRRSGAQLQGIERLLETLHQDRKQHPKLPELSPSLANRQSPPAASFPNPQRAHSKDAIADKPIDLPPPVPAAAPSPSKEWKFQFSKKNFLPRKDTPETLQSELRSLLRSNFERLAKKHPDEKIKIQIALKVDNATGTIHEIQFDRLQGSGIPSEALTTMFESMAQKIHLNFRLKRLEQVREVILKVTLGFQPSR